MALKPVLVVTSLGLFAWACGSEPNGCTKDTECKGSRVCGNGMCVDPPTAGGTATAGGSTAGGSSQVGGGSATTSTLTVSPSSLIANGTATSAITFTLLDANRNPLAGAPVSLSVSGNGNSVGSTMGATSASGVFSTTLSSTVAEAKTVTATAGAVTKVATVTFLAGAASPTTSTLVVNPSSVTADGTSTSTITFTLLDANSNPVAGASVMVATGGTGNTLGASAGSTTMSGVFVTTMASTVAGPKTVTATAGALSKTEVVTFTAGAASATRSSVSASPGRVLANGISSATIAITLRDANDNVIIGALPVLSSTGSATLVQPVATNSSGQTTGTIASSTTGSRTVTASVVGAAVGTTTVTFVTASAEWVNDPATLTTLAVSSTGMANTTPVLFRVRDAVGTPVEGVDVDFVIAPNSAAGCSLLPLRDRTNSMGIARTTLSTGDAQGTAVVIARIVSLPDTLSPNFDIVIGRVNEGRMQLSCTRKTLGALQAPSPPRIDQNTTCTVSLVDRAGRNPPFPLNVSWLTEAGSTAPMSTSVAGATSVSTVFNTGGALPVPTTPLPAVAGPFSAPAEPSSGSNNPRDNFVSIVAAVQGEEEFWDGSGSSGGLTNGTWDPGEYWVDLAEPFADNNDNGRWDPGEPYIDTARTNCVTGLIEPRNNQWDPPNGCWDRATQVWKTTHIVYAGGPVSGAGAVGTFLRFSPPLPSFMAPDTTQQISVTWTDAFFNRFSSDSANVSVTSVAGSRGSATIASGGITGEEFGHRLEYFAMRAQVSDAGVVIAEEGVCDPQEPDSGYPDVRCFRTYRFRDWRTTAPTATMTLVAPNPQTLADGGTPQATNTTWELRATNSLQFPSAYQFTVAFP